MTDPNSQQAMIDQINDAAELIHAAYINLFDNLIDRMQRGDDHPLVKIGRIQLKEGLKILGRDIDNG